MTPADDIEDTNPGLARERTEFSWTRTAISFAALGSAILKSRPYAGIAILVLSALVWQLGQLAGASGAGRDRSRRLLLIAVAVIGVSIVPLAIALLGSRAQRPPALTAAMMTGIDQGNRGRRAAQACRCYRRHRLKFTVAGDGGTSAQVTGSGVPA